jgi:hypothetical protein
MLANDRDGLGWGNVVAGSPVWFLFVGTAIEIFLDDLLPSRKSVAPAHGEIMADSPVFNESAKSRFLLDGRI